MEPEIEDIFHKVFRQQHETFAVELIQRLKYHYRLYDSRKCPKTFLYATDDVCDAIYATSFVFRCHYRQVYYFLRDELADAEEYEKFCFSLPVARSKRYTFNFLFRISFMFEIGMYLFKDGHDYLHITEKCIANYPDHLHFDVVGNWKRLNDVSTFLICISKVWKIDIAIEHPLLGTFIETEKFIGPDDVFDINLLLQESLEIDRMLESGAFPIYEEDFFKHDNIESLKVLYKRFVAPRTPNIKFKTKDLNKMAETFPLNREFPFVIDGKSFSKVHDLFAEKKEIWYYLQSYMDPEILENVKTSPDSPDEVQDYSKIEDPFALESSEDESSKSCFSKVSFPHECSNKKVYTNGESPCKTMMSCEKVSTSMDHSYDESEECSEIPHVNQCMQLPNECSEIPHVNQCTQLLKEDSEIPHLFSSIPDLPVDKKVALIKFIVDISHMSKKIKDNLIKFLPNMPEAQYFDLSFLTNILMAVQHCTYFKTNGMTDSLRNLSYASRNTKYILFKVLLSCNQLKSDKRSELFSLLVNLPENPIAHKVKIIQIIQKMNGCTNQIKSELIQCLLDLSDEDCTKFHISDSEMMDFIEQYNVPFINEENLLREYQKCLLLYKDESKSDMDRLQELCRHYNIPKEYLSKLAKEDAAKQLASRTIAVPNKSRQESSKYFKNEKDPKKNFPVSEDVNKCFGKGAVSAGTSSVESNPVLVVGKSHQKSVSGPSKNKHSKSIKKSKKRSNK